MGNGYELRAMLKKSVFSLRELDRRRCPSVELSPPPRPSRHPSRKRRSNATKKSRADGRASSPTRLERRRRSAVGCARAAASAVAAADDGSPLGAAAKQARRCCVCRCRRRHRHCRFWPRRWLGAGAGRVGGGGHDSSSSSSISRGRPRRQSSFAVGSGVGSSGTAVDGWQRFEDAGDRIVDERLGVITATAARGQRRGSGGGDGRGRGSVGSGARCCCCSRRRRRARRRAGVAVALLLLLDRPCPHRAQSRSGDGRRSGRHQGEKRERDCTVKRTRLSFFGGARRGAARGRFARSVDRKKAGLT